MRIIFAGTPDFAAAHLQALIDQLDELPAGSSIVAVYTQPDRRAGRGKKNQPSPVKQLALEHGLDVRQPLSLKDPDAQAELRALDADIMVVAAYGLLLPTAVLEAPRLGCINVHASLLPRWRGAAPVERSILAGDNETGVTIMQMDEGLDTGAMLLTETCTIDADETGDSLREKLIATGRPLLIKALQDIDAGSIQAVAQDDAASCYAPKLQKAEAQINWQQAASTIERQLRAFDSALACYSLLDGERLRIRRATTTSEPDLIKAAAGAMPGEILACNRQHIAVCAGPESTADSNSVLCLEQVQLAGKKPMSAADVINGYAERFAVGEQFSLPAEHGATNEIC